MTETQEQKFITTLEVLASICVVMLIAAKASRHFFNLESNWFGWIALSADILYCVLYTCGLFKINNARTNLCRKHTDLFVFYILLLIILFVSAYFSIKY